MDAMPRIELIASLSVATDLALGSRLESGLGACLVAMRFSRAIGLTAVETSAVYHMALVRHIGCTADNHLLADTFGSEMGLHELIETQDFRDVPGMTAALGRHTRSALPTQAPSAVAQRLVSAMPLLVETTLAACEVGGMLADRFEYGPDVRSGLLASYERWDGHGIPGRLAGGEIPLAVRVVQVAEAAVGARLRGEDPVAWLRDRAGGALDPDLVEGFSNAANELLAALDAPTRWSAVVALEPAPRHSLSGPGLDRALQAIGEFADLKSPYLVGHSAHVAALAGDAATIAGLPVAEARDVRRAGWIHDLGRVAVSAATWGRPGPLSRDEWERVRLHPYHTGRLLDGGRTLAGLGAIATLHHERLDGSGYVRAAPAALIPMAARILGAADVYAAMTETRPHRAAIGGPEAARSLRAEARAARLDGRAVEAVLAAAGHRRLVRSGSVAGLTAREIEVLGLVARGQTNRAIADALVVSLKTVDAHVQHIYAKAGVRTRSAATMFAMQHGLLPRA